MEPPLGTRERTLLRLETPATAESVQVVRRAAAALDRIHRSADVASRLAIILTELATNVVKHSTGRTIEVELALSGDRLTGVVRDDGRGFAATKPAAPRVDATSGRGLFLLDALADEWHLDTSDGARVAFAFELDAGAADEPLTRSADERPSSKLR